jgi:hypothetical protein
LDRLSVAPFWEIGRTIRLRSDLIRGLAVGCLRPRFKFKRCSFAQTALLLHWITAAICAALLPSVHIALHAFS